MGAGWGRGKLQDSPANLGEGGKNAAETKTCTGGGKLAKRQKSRCMTLRWGTAAVHPCFRSELQPSQANSEKPTANQTSGLDFHDPLSETSTRALNRCPFPAIWLLVIEITHLVSQSRDSFILL
jgi:hypothetical protein